MNSPQTPGDRGFHPADAYSTHTNDHIEGSLMSQGPEVTEVIFNIAKMYIKYQTVYS